MSLPSTLHYLREHHKFILNKWIKDDVLFELIDKYTDYNDVTSKLNMNKTIAKFYPSITVTSEPNDFGLFRMSMNTQKNGRVTRYYFIHDINSTLTKAECAKFDTNPIDSMDSYPRTRNTTSTTIPFFATPSPPRKVRKLNNEASVKQTDRLRSRGVS